MKLTSDKKEGLFSRYCTNKGYKKITCECILRGMKSSNPDVRKRAVFAYNFGFKKHGKKCASVEDHYKKNKKTMAKDRLSPKKVKSSSSSDVEYIMEHQFPKDLQFEYIEPGVYSPYADSSSKSESNHLLKSLNKFITQINSEYGDDFVVARNATTDPDTNVFSADIYFTDIYSRSKGIKGSMNTQVLSSFDPTEYIKKSLNSWSETEIDVVNKGGVYLVTIKSSEDNISTNTSLLLKQIHHLSNDMEKMGWVPVYDGHTFNKIKGVVEVIISPEMKYTF